MKNGLVAVVLGTTFLLAHLASATTGEHGTGALEPCPGPGLLIDPQRDLAQMEHEAEPIEDKIAAPAGKFKLSSGLFGLPATAASVDWMIVNDAATSETFTVTVYKAGVGAKTVVAPGSLTFTLAPGEVAHNANSVGHDAPFVRGFYYEVVVETSSPDLLPSVHVWQDHGNTVIPGTLIPPGSWVRLH